MSRLERGLTHVAGLSRPAATAEAGDAEVTLTTAWTPGRNVELRLEERRDWVLVHAFTTGLDKQLSATSALQGWR